MVYTITLIFSVFFAWLASRVKNKGVMILCSIISVLIPAIIAGIRDRVGTDTMVYAIPDAMSAYTSQSFSEFVSVSLGAEPGYRLLCYVTMKTLGHPNWCLFFYQLITTGCFYIGAYKHRKIAPLPLLMLGFLCMYYVNSFNTMRQSMAVSIIFMGINNLEEKKYWRFMSYIIVAFTFHYSTIAVVALILIPHMIISRQSAYFKYFILGALIICLILIRPIATLAINLNQSIGLVPVKYTSYLDITQMHGKGDSFSITHLLVQLGTFLIFLFYPKGAEKRLDKCNVDFYKYNMVLDLILTHVVLLFSRLMMYNQVINVISYAAMPYFVKDKYFKLFLIVMLIISLFYLLYSNFSLKGWYYRSILDY